MRSRGFSLIELLVTLFIIVLVTSLVSLNVGMGDRDYQLETQFEGLADAANYALDEAQFAGWDFGLYIDVDSTDSPARYRFQWLERGTEGWRPPATQRDIFDPVTLPPELLLELTLDGNLQDEEVVAGLATPAQPQLVLYASGETLPGTLDLLEPEGGRLLWRLDWDLLGNFRARTAAQLEEQGELP